MQNIERLTAQAWRLYSRLADQRRAALLAENDQTEQRLAHAHRRALARWHRRARAGLDAEFVQRRSRRSPWVWIVRLFSALLTFTLLVSCGASSHRVEYRIGGSSGSVNITMVNAHGGMEQLNIKPPYILAFDLPAGQPIYVSGQNQWNAGVVTCDVLIDGQSASSSTSTLPYGVVTCGGHT